MSLDTCVTGPKHIHSLFHIIICSDPPPLFQLIKIIYNYEFFQHLTFFEVCME